MKKIQITVEIWVWRNFNCGLKYGSLGRSHQISPDQFWFLRLRDRKASPDMDTKIPRDTEERPTGLLRYLGPRNQDRLFGSIFAEEEDISFGSVIGDRDMDNNEGEGWQGFTDMSYWRIWKPWSRKVWYIRPLLAVRSSLGVFSQHYGHNLIGLPKGGRYGRYGFSSAIDDHRGSRVGCGSINTRKTFEIIHTQSFPVFHLSILSLLLFCIWWECDRVMSQASLLKARGSTRRIGSRECCSLMKLSKGLSQCLFMRLLISFKPVMARTKQYRCFWMVFLFVGYIILFFEDPCGTCGDLCFINKITMVGLSGDSREVLWFTF